MVSGAQQSEIKKSQATNSSKPSFDGTETITLNPTGHLTVEMREQEEKQMLMKIPSLKDIAEREGTDIIAILVDLMRYAIFTCISLLLTIYECVCFRYQYEPLAPAATELLLLHGKKHSKLLDGMDRVQLLVSSAEKKNFKDTKQNITKLRLLAQTSEKWLGDDVSWETITDKEQQAKKVKQTEESALRVYKLLTKLTSSMMHPAYTRAASWMHRITVQSKSTPVPSPKSKGGKLPPSLSGAKAEMEPQAPFKHVVFGHVLAPDMDRKLAWDQACVDGDRQNLLTNLGAHRVVLGLVRETYHLMRGYIETANKIKQAADKLGAPGEQASQVFKEQKDLKDKIIRYKFAQDPLNYKMRIEEQAAAYGVRARCNLYVGVMCVACRLIFCWWPCSKLLLNSCEFSVLTILVIKPN